ncbi:killer toxin alpha beta [Fusarium heterosporum]|uniref:chitinase n=1 Tax=Fusarium heterosporum TaxID=42747 RepID=A0A8H5TA87_FUSHE|nr:killer toxin alpha beta [Fusarium heterosporum]
MRTHIFIPFVGFLAGLSSAATSSANSTRLGPFDASKAQNSTENELDLGITPIAPYGEKQTSEEWATPLIEGCPRLCSTAGLDAAKWTHIHNFGDLEGCEAPMLFDLNIHSEAVETIRVCALNGPSSSSKASVHLRAHVHQGAARRHSKRADADSEDDKATSGRCSPAPLSPVPVIVTSGLAGALNATSDIAVAIQGLKQHIAKKTSCGKTILFSKAGSAVVGLYVSADMGSVAGTAILERFEKAASQGTQMMQACDINSMNPYTFGVFAVDKVSEFEIVRKNMQIWADGYCLAMPLTRPRDIKLKVNIPGGDLFTGLSNGTSSVSLAGSSTDLEARAECKTTKVLGSDTCTTLSVKCNIRGADFVKYNPKANLCSTLIPGQFVCCSSGTLPDNTPTADKDGTCATHKIDAGDTCASVAAASSITVKDIEAYNKASWAWAGCNRLQLGQIICLSKGNTPMPSTVEGVACGPQKPGTKRPSGSFDGWDLTKLNQCPLNACCSGWGFCGTTTEFCTESPADTKAPGAFKIKTNGCISNCGTDIVNNKSPPKEFKRIGYFQAYNPGRPCMHMDASEIEDNFSDLTHVHFAFAGITSDYDVNIPDDVKKQFDIFDKMDAPFKKILSFGGWAESTDAATFQRYRDVVKPEHRSVFAANIVKFLEKHKSFDGVDIDWEYPGATDQGIPAGDRTDGLYYHRFLSVLRNLLPSSKSIYIALPGSYWYLKPFPVDQMAKVLDYFVFMTYDLHGQWDYGNKFANPGCENGNCLRSHINRTETRNSMSMITKAGVPAEKVIIGIASYGRSFRMADKSCTGPRCHFTGSFSVSDAEPGQCTNTGGYISNAELDEIWQMAGDNVEGISAKRWYDATTDSDIMTYGTQGNGMTDWVAYMSDKTKRERVLWIKLLNFGGTTDWAIDLAGYFEGPSTKGGSSNGGWSDFKADDLSCDSNSWPNTLEKLANNIDSINANCRAMATMSILVKDLIAAVDEYKDVSKNYNSAFGWYADWVKDGIDDRIEEFLAPARGKGLKYLDCEWHSPKGSDKGRCDDTWPPRAPGGSNGARIITFTMRDEEGFYKALLEEAGIHKDWVEWVKDDAKPDLCTCKRVGVVEQCMPAGCQPGRDYEMRHNWLRRIRDKSKIEVSNPKKVLDEAIPSTDDLITVAISTFAEMRLGISDAKPADIVTSFSMPIFMMQDASESIKEIKEIGEEMKKTHTRNLVLDILTIVFAVIPFAGQAAQAIGGAARIATAALIIGEAGNAALSIVEIVENPESAPFAILGMLIGAAGLRGGKVTARDAFEQAADARRALSADAMKAFSPEFREKDKLVQSIVKSCGFR